MAEIVGKHIDVQLWRVSKISVRDDAQNFRGKKDTGDCNGSSRYCVQNEDGNDADKLHVAGLDGEGVVDRKGQETEMVKGKLNGCQNLRSQPDSFPR